MAALTELLDRWQADLAGWAIPEHITASAPDSPWVLPREVFARRADRQSERPGGASFERAAGALAPAGTVLDVGCGAGAASLPLAPWTTGLTLVDTDADMLGMAAERAAAAGVSTRTVTGRWPDIAGEVPPADVVTCFNVLYNVPDLGPFLAALTSHARRLVVVEMTAAHPLIALNPLWQRFWGLERPQNQRLRTYWRSWLRWACERGRLNGTARPGPTIAAWRNWQRSPGAGYACRPDGRQKYKLRCWRREQTRGAPVTWEHPDGMLSRCGGRTPRERVASRLVP